MHHHGGVRHGGVRGEGVLDLARFDAEAADLDLVVGAAEVVDPSVRAPARQVTGAVHAFARGAVGAADEALGGQAGLCEVAAGQARSGEVELSGDADRDRSQPLVEDVGAGVVHRRADRHGALGHLAGAVQHGERRGLRGAVAVGEHGLRPGGECLGDHGGRERLAAGQHLAHLGQGAGVAFDEQVEECGREEGRGDVAFADGAYQGVRVELSGRCEDHFAAVEQRYPQLVGGGVERGGGVHEYAAVVAAAPHVVGGEARDVAVGDRHALGASGGAGGEHDVRHPVGAARGRRAGDVRRVGGGGQFGGDVEHVHRVGVGVLQVLAVHEENARPGLGHDQPHAGGGVAGVQRHIHAAGLEDGQDRHGHPHGAFHQQAHRVLGAVGADPPGAQPGGEPVGERAELAVGQPLVAAADRDGVGGAGRLCPEQFGQAGRGLLAGGAVPLGEHAVPLGRGEQVDVADRLVRVGDHRQYHLAQPAQHGADRLRVEDVGVVLDAAVDAARCAVAGEVLVCQQDQVHACRAGAAHHRCRLDAGQVQGLVGDALPGQHDLDERVVGHRAGGPQAVHEGLEGDVAVGEGVQGAFAYRGEQFPERLAVRDLCAQHEGVGEEADQVLGGLVVASRARHADGDVGAGAQAAEQYGQCRVEDHEHADVAGAGQPGQALVQVGVPLEGEGVPVVGGLGRVRAVDGQGDPFGQALQRAAPVVQLT